MAKNYKQFNLLEVADISGIRISKYEGTKKYIATADIDLNQIISGTEVTYEDRPSRADLSMKQDEVLFAKMKGTKKVLSGSREVENLIFSTGFYILKPKENVSKKYLYFFLLSDYFNTQKDAFCSGATMAAIGNAGLKKIQISIPVNSKGAPDLAEQDRVAYLLEEAEKLQKKRKEVDQKTENLFNSMFDDAFGNLNTTDLPKRPLKEVTVFVTDGTHLPPPFTTEGIPFLFVKNITKGFIDFNTEKYVSEESYIKLTKKYRPQKYDILYSTVGSYGVAVMVGTDNKFTFQRHIGHIRPDTKLILPEFLNAQLNTAFVKKQADLKVRGVAQKTLNLDELRKIVIVVPPMDRQRSFVERLKKLQDIQIKQKESAMKIDNLFTSLLAKHTNN